MVRLETSTPNKLLNSFKAAIKAGHVDTWSCDSDGDFKHTPPQWADKGWLRPTVVEGVRLNLTFLGREETTLAAYSVLQGRFIEAMIRHCPNLFSVGSATAKPTDADSPRLKTA